MMDDVDGLQPSMVSRMFLFDQGTSQLELVGVWFRPAYCCIIFYSRIRPSSFAQCWGLSIGNYFMMFLAALFVVGFKDRPLLHTHLQGLALVHSLLVGAGIRDKVKIIAAGKIMSGMSILETLAYGADLCNSARGMLFALGCIQALKCNTNKCPTGITTQVPQHPPTPDPAGLHSSLGV